MGETLSVCVAGGGTAGHIEPAMAVAEELRERGHRVIALGTTKGLEITLVPQRGFDLKLIRPVPVPRKVSKDLIMLPWNLWRTVRETKKILTDNAVNVLVGFGGYVSAPAYLAAKIAGIPVVVHEANARAGVANKLGVALGGLGLNAVGDSGLKGRVVGIPLRAELGKDCDWPAERERAFQLWGLDRSRPVVFVTGGSQGSLSLNNAIVALVPELVANGFQVLHAYGKKNQPGPAHDHYHPVPYIDTMAPAYAVAEVVVCRSGAMTVAEITAAGTPAIYVPLPHGNGEQGLNAAAVIKAGGAITLADAEVGTQLGPTLMELLGDPGRLDAMRAANQASGLADATGTIADIVISQAKKN